jgi:hypothetical protein
MTQTGEQDEVSPVNGITIEINNYSTLDIPVKMEPSQTLKLGKDGKLELYDRNWKLIETIMTGKIPSLSNGKNVIMVDAGFIRQGSSKLKLEVKTIGKNETIQKNSN